MNDDISERPDPDKLLDQIKEQDTGPKKGKLKIFLGMSAGVGKTYAMLQEAVSLSRKGRNVLACYVETHGRAETDLFLNDLTILPRKIFDYKGMKLEEPDIDAVVSLNPSLALVDELAHTNAPGSRHAKRYQDVFELLDHGIDVYTTLNIQHVESRVDTVESITGIRIQERVPDTVLDRADEIECVDIVPDELRRRMEEGKIYLPENAKRAMEGFFREGTLIALREMALRYTAGKVDTDLREYMKRENIREIWKSGERLLVAVSPSPYSEYLIRWTRRTAANLKSQWTALYIESSRPLSSSAIALLNKNLSLARELGADVASTADEDIVAGVMRYARENNITQLVIGKPLVRSIKDFFRGGNLADRMIQASGDLDIHVVSQPAIHKGRKRYIPSLVFNSPWRQYVAAAAAVSLTTAIGKSLTLFTGYWTVGLLYLFSISLISLFLGRGPVIAAAAFSALLWDFLFIPPLFTFRVATIEDAFMLVMYFATALIAGSLTTKLRSREQFILKREERQRELFDLTSGLAKAHSLDMIVEASVSRIGKLFNADVAIVPAGGTDADPEPHPAGTLALEKKDLAVVRWVFNSRQKAGLSTSTLSMADALYLPLEAPGGIAGVIGIKPRSEKAISPDEDAFMQSMVQQIAIALERERLYALHQKTKVSEESDRLYRILLSSISHEMRTPLSAIAGAADALVDEAVASDPATLHSLSSEIKTASLRLNRVVEHLLDMSRIESGKLSLRKEPNDLHDLLSVVIRDCGPFLCTHSLKTVIPADFPLLLFDFTLIEEVLINLIHNAVVHAPTATEIKVQASLSGQKALITVSDNGQGIPEDELPRLFDKFFRGCSAAPGGTGLGLSICRGIVEAHGGTVTAGNMPDGGAVFTIALPRPSHVFSTEEQQR